MKKSALIFALIVGLLASASTLQAQTVNMSRYITLTVKSGEAIKLNFRAVYANTPVRIVSGSNTEDLTVGTNWYNGSNPSTFTVTADGTEMKVYGDIVAFRCSFNYANLTALDPSHNTQLTELDCSYNNLNSLDVSNNTQLKILYCNTNQLTSLDVSNNTQLIHINCSFNTLSSLDVSKNTQLKALDCWNNNFSTQDIDDIYCSLPVRQASDNAKIQPIYSNTSPNHATILASNKANATSKNWKVQYANDNADIATTGSYMCPVEYDLKIAGMQVTSDNCSDLSVISGVSGTVKYDPSTKVLTLENATIQIDTTNALFSKIDGLTIKVIGTNTLTTGNSTTLLLAKSLTITGGGVLNVNSGGNCAIYVYGTNLTIDGCTVNAKGGYGIVGRNGSSETLTIKNSTVTAEGTAGSIADFASLTLDGCAITWPAGAAFDASLHALALGGAKVKSKVVISPTGGGTTYYYLRIAGVQVTSANCSDLSVIDSVSGTVKYDPTTNVLTLQNATIKINTINAIDSYIDGLTIKVIGTNNLITESYTALSLGKPLTITGGGVLNTNSVGDCGIYAKQTNLTIDGCTVNAKGKYGITGNDGSSEMLIIKNSTVTAEGTAGSIVDFADLTLDGCAITQPSGAAFDASLKAVALGGAVVKSKVVISPTGGGTTTYDLKIAGVQVTSANCSDLSVIDSVSGTVKYDPTNKVLTLENATIQTNTYAAIFSYIDGLTIKVIGTNNITTNNTTLSFIKPLTITGGGVLNANSGNSYAIYAERTNLTIDGCTVNAKGVYGITGFDGSSEMLTIKNSTVTAEGTDGSIDAFASLTLDGCAITQPAGAAFDASLKAVALNGEKVTSKVVISKNSTDIAEATAEPALTLYPNPVADMLYLSATARTIRVYNIYGTEVAHATDTDRVEVSHLPAGVYTVRADGTVAKMVKR